MTKKSLISTVVVAACGVVAAMAARFGEPPSKQDTPAPPNHEQAARPMQQESCTPTPSQTPE